MIGNSAPNKEEESRKDKKARRSDGKKQDKDKVRDEDKGKSNKIDNLNKSKTAKKKQSKDKDANNEKRRCQPIEEYSDSDGYSSYYSHYSSSSRRRSPSSRSEWPPRDPRCLRTRSCSRRRRSASHRRKCQRDRLRTRIRSRSRNKLHISKDSTHQRPLHKQPLSLEKKEGCMQNAHVEATSEENTGVTALSGSGPLPMEFCKTEWSTSRGRSLDDRLIGAWKQIAQSQNEIVSLNHALISNMLSKVQQQTTIARVSSTQASEMSEALASKEVELTSKNAQIESMKCQIDDLVAQSQSQADLLNLKSEEIDTLRSEIGRLRKEAMSEVSSVACCEWQYEDAGKWHSFAVDANSRAYQMYQEYLQNGDGIVKLDSGGCKRKIDFNKMVQVNQRTGMERKIRMNLHVPCLWTSSHKTLLQQGCSWDMFVEEESQAVWDAITAAMTQTAHPFDGTQPKSICHLMGQAVIQNVYRIENFNLWSKYRHCKQQIARDCVKAAQATVGPLLGCLALDAQHIKALSGGDQLAEQVNEKILLHGTTEANVWKIAESGFEHRVCHHGMYGLGSYFASQSCKSHQYTCAVHHHGCKCPVRRSMVVTRVVLGDPFYTEKVLPDVRVPPERFGAPGRYSSIIARPGHMVGHHRNYQDHQEFVIFDQAQAYPSYVVEYTLR